VNSISLLREREPGYGCTLCQAEHYRSEALYLEHLMYQSKHGIDRERPTGQWSLTGQVEP
jgi:hypothetical protein